MTSDVFALAFPSPWPFWSEGLELDGQGRLGLAELPAWPELADSSGAPAGGLGVGGGRAYFTCGDSVMVRECDGSQTRFGALGSGAGLGSVLDPRGLAVSPLHTLIVADYGNDRVQEFDLTTGQMVWVWPGIQTPEDVTADDNGQVFVSAHEGVLRLDRAGGQTVIAPAADLGGRCHSLALGVVGNGPGLFVSTGTTRPRVHAVPFESGDDTSELQAVLHRVVGTAAPRHPLPPAALSGPILLRSHGHRLYLASRATGTIRVVSTVPPALLGDLPGAAVPFSAIALDDSGTLWASDCDGAAASKHTASLSSGSARIGPIPLRLDPEARHSLRVRSAGRWRVGGATVAASFTPEPDATDDPIGIAPDGFVDIPPSTTAVTVHIRLTSPQPGSAFASPPYLELVELRVDEPGWIEHLPAIFRSQGDPAAFLDPYLRLVRSGHDDVEAALLDLPNQLDPATAIDDLDGDSWLDWLATWVDVDLDERWDRAIRRSVVRHAFRRHGVRGTRAGLQHLIKAELGLDVSISEPGDLANVWLLGDDIAQLGLATMTAAGPASGSLVDVTAVADRSHLIGPNEYGAPLFGDIAHRFDVRVHASQIQCEDDVNRLRALIEREKPAHTTAHLCIIQPGISVGIQSRIDVDAVIGGETDPRAVSGLEGFQSARPGGRVALGDDGSLVLN